MFCAPAWSRYCVKYYVLNNGEERKQNDELKMEAEAKRAVNKVAVANTLFRLTKKILVHAPKIRHPMKQNAEKQRGKKVRGRHHDQTHAEFGHKKEKG